MSDTIYIPVSGDGTIKEIPDALHPYHEQLQAFVDKQDLVGAQQYAIKALFHDGEIYIPLMASQMSIRLTRDTGDTP
jgi:hypothetical protein